LKYRNEAGPTCQSKQPIKTLAPGYRSPVCVRATAVGHALEARAPSATRSTPALTARHMRRASILIAHGLSSKPSPFPSPREATLLPCSASHSTLPLVASADDHAVSAASDCACGCPRPQAGAVPRRTPERPNAIIPFGCLPTTTSSEPPPPSSAASSYGLPPPPTSRAPH
jgi:hypothetical protein